MSEVVKYNAEGLEPFQVLVQDETVWLTQAQIAELFGTKRPAITKHLSNIFSAGELVEKVVCSILEHTTHHGAIKGKTQTVGVKRYNLDAILSVGYRVNSKRATQFRQWATQVLREHLLRGYTIKQPVSVEQLNSVKDEIQELANEINELLQHVDKTDSFVYEEFGRVYEIIHQLTEQKRQQESEQKRPFGYAACPVITSSSTS